MQGRSCPWRVHDRAERPVTLQPRENHVVKGGVKRGVVRADPGTDDRVPPGPGAVRAVSAGRVDVDTADNVAGAGAEHAVGKPAALSEVLRVAPEVAEVIRLGHLVRPAPPGEPRGSPDVVGTGGPGGIVRGIVLRPERLQAEFPRREPVRHREVGGNEQLVTHRAMLVQAIAYASYQERPISAGWEQARALELAPGAAAREPP